MKVALITGGNSGIGLATVKLFIKNGYKVFAHFNKQTNNLNKIKNKNLYLVQADLSNLNETEKLFNDIVKDTKKIDVLVNNAATYNKVDNLSQLDLDLLDTTLNINLKSPFILSKKFIELNRDKNYGRIINISSIGVKYGGSEYSMPYTISKAALETMTVAFAKEGAKYNILVNALRVGVCDTNIHRGLEHKNMDHRISMIPLKRMAEPKEIAEYILLLASNKSNFTTGSIITIAGGE